jgi:hypothetical protein
MQTYNIKSLKVCRELHSLQVNDLIAILCSSASRQQLPHSQHQHAQQPQATHAHQHKSRNKRGNNLQLQQQQANSQDEETQGL